MMLFLLSLLTVHASDVKWDYSKNGTDWPGKCADGASQSPINIKKSKTKSLGDKFTMQVYYYGKTASRTVVNNGKYIYIEGDFGYITIRDSKSKDRKFLTTKIVFHIPSEHYFESYPTHMEMQIFHKVDDSDYTFDFPCYAIVSIMLRPGDESYFFTSISVANLPKANEETVLPDTANVNLLSIVSPDDYYFFYNGSFSEPECDENVLRYVFETEQWISFVQINYFKALFITGSDAFSGPGNSRAIQSLNSRDVYYSFAMMIGGVYAIAISLF